MATQWNPSALIVKANSIACADWHMWTAHCNWNWLLHTATGIRYTGGFSCCKLHQSICFSTPAQRTCELKHQRCNVVFTTIWCCRHEKKKQKVEPAAPQRRKTDEEKVSSKQFQCCLVLHFLVSGSKVNVLGAFRRLQKGFFLFSLVVKNKSELLMLLVVSTNKVLNSWSCNERFFKLYLYICSGNKSPVSE